MITLKDLEVDLEKPEGEDVFTISDSRIGAGKLLDQHHAPLGRGNPYGWDTCEVCDFGVRPASKTLPARHIPYAAGVAVILRWLGSR